MRFIVFTLVLLASLVLVPVTSVLAHSPVFPEENHGPSTAYEIDDPAKSWAIYTWLEHEGTADYYMFTVSEGEKIQVSLIVPDNPARSGFLPAFTLIGPGLTQHDIVPDYVEVPMDYGTIVVNGTDAGEAVYEPFTPGWLYQLGTLTMSAPSAGTYYIAVYNPDLHENAHNHIHKANGYAIIVGYVEEFTPTELILIPYRVHAIYVWEGQNLFTIFLPTGLVVLIGGVITYQRSKRDKHLRGLSKWLATFGGLAFLGTAAGTIYQIVFTFTRTGIAVEALITLVIVIVSIVLGVLTLRYALRRKPNLTIWRRVGLLVIALVALFSWSGLYLGPGLLIAAALVPPYVKNRKHPME
jgi:glucose uptake protein GlcU